MYDGAAEVIAAAVPGGGLYRMLRRLQADLPIELYAAGSPLIAAAGRGSAATAVIELGLADLPAETVAREMASNPARRVYLAGPHDEPLLASAAADGMQRIELPCTLDHLRTLLSARPHWPPGMNGAEPAAVAAALGAGWRALRGVAVAVTGNRPINAAEVGRAAGEIAGLAGSSGLRRILDLLRSHHDPTYAHSLRVASGLTLFGAAVDMTETDLRLLAMAGILHDIGKIAVPSAVLTKPGRLDAGERTLVRRHPVTGEQLLRRSMGIPAAVIDVAARHHERLDGTGYPNGLAHHRIDDLSRLAAVVDVHVALSEPRAYKPAMTDEAAFALMLEAEPRGLEPSYLRTYREIVLDTRRRDEASLRRGADGLPRPRP